MSAALPGPVGVVGLGLVGASLCAGLRARLGGLRLVGVTRSAQTAQRALDEGVCDRAGVDPELLAECGLVVLCTPVDAMPHWLRACAAHAPAALVTDTGSTKAWVCAQAAALLPSGRFCGGHPMAGRERSGYDAADPGLFAGCVWVLTPDSEAALRAFGPWRAAVETLGARVEVMDAASHDAATALVSHMPLALSSALMRAVVADPAWEAGWRLAATGLRDMVRLAGGDPAMYAAIAQTNREPILRALEDLMAEVDRLVDAFESQERLRDYFGVARRERAQWLEDRIAAGSPLP